MAQSGGHLEKFKKYLINIFLAPTGALGVQIWDLCVCVCVCVHFMHSSFSKGALRGNLTGNSRGIQGVIQGVI